MTQITKNTIFSELLISHSYLIPVVNRFGITINYSKPTPKEFREIVLELAKRNGIKMKRIYLKGKIDI